MINTNNTIKVMEDGKLTAEEVYDSNKNLIVRINLAEDEKTPLSIEKGVFSSKGVLLKGLEIPLTNDGCPIEYSLDETELGLVGTIGNKNKKRSGRFTNHRILTKGRVDFTTGEIVISDLEEINGNIFEGKIEGYNWALDKRVRVKEALGVLRSIGTFAFDKNTRGCYLVSGQTCDNNRVISECKLQKLPDGFKGEFKDRSNFSYIENNKVVLVYGDEIYKNGTLNNEKKIQEGILAYSKEQLIGNSYIEDHGIFDSNENLYRGQRKVYDSKGKLKCIEQIDKGKKVKLLKSPEVSEGDKLRTVQSFMTTYYREVLKEGRDF